MNIFSEEGLYKTYEKNTFNYGNFKVVILF